MNSKAAQIASDHGNDKDLLPLDGLFTKLQQLSFASGASVALGRYVQTFS